MQLCPRSRCSGCRPLSRNAVTVPDSLVGRLCPLSNARAAAPQHIDRPIDLRESNWSGQCRRNGPDTMCLPNSTALASLLRSQATHSCPADRPASRRLACCRLPLDCCLRLARQARPRHPCRQRPHKLPRRRRVDLLKHGQRPPPPVALGDGKSRIRIKFCNNASSERGT